MGDDLLYEVRDQVAYLTINRPSRRNSLTQEMIGGFIERLGEARRDESVRVLCVTGAGDKAFCCGADLDFILTKPGQHGPPGARQYAQLLKEMARFGRPLVARVNGPCLAGGLGIMLSCDIVIARDDAFFSTPEIDVGLFPMMIGALLLRHLGRKKAAEMVLTGRRISAAEAERMGLITRAVSPHRLNEEVQAVIELLKSKSPIVMSMGKEAFRRASDMPFEEAVDYLCDALGRVLQTEDAREGIRAFVEKRRAVFNGR